jgi:hypothetical protein
MLPTKPTDLKLGAVVASDLDVLASLAKLRLPRACPEYESAVIALLTASWGPHRPPVHNRKWDAHRASSQRQSVRAFHAWPTRRWTGSFA